MLSNSISSRFANDFAYRVLVCGIAGCAGFVLVLIIGFLTYESIFFVSQFGLEPLRTEHWYPTENLYGLQPMILGSLGVTLVALFISLPTSLFCAIFSRFYAPLPLAILFRRLMEVFAGLPSVIFGLWGLLELVPSLREFRAPGTSVIADSLVLSLMIVPTMTLLIDGTFQQFPRKFYNSGLSLGLKKGTIVRNLVLPYSLRGINTSVVLGFGRAVGETMAVLMVAGNVVQVPDSLFDPVRTLTATIALEMAYAMDEHRGALFFCGWILCVLVGLLVAVTRVEKNEVEF